MNRLVYFLIVPVLVSSVFGQTIYGIKSKHISGSSSEPGQYAVPATLYKFNDDGTDFDEIAPITNSGSQVRADALAYSESLGLWCFQISPSVSSTLCQIDPNTAVVISDDFVYSDRQIFGATFDRHGYLWAIDQTYDELLKIDVSTGTILSQVILTLDGSSYDLTNAAGDICFDALGQAYMVDHNYIYQLDIYSGSLTLLFTDLSTRFLVGTVVPTDSLDTLITFDVILTSIDNDDVFVYDLNNLGYPEYLFESILDDYNAGRGDLATDIPADLTARSLFDADSADWTAARLSKEYSLIETLDVSYDEQGYISVEDANELLTVFSAPSIYLGDKSEWLGGDISFDLMTDTAGTLSGQIAIILVGADFSLYSPTILPTDTWGNYSVSLTPQGWSSSLATVGGTVTVDMMYQVLSNLQAVYIIADFTDQSQTTYLDNVQMVSGLSVDSDLNEFVDLVDFGIFAEQWKQTSCTADTWCDGQDFDKSGTVDLEDLYYLAVNWLDVIY